jgi:hypothetical protein
MKNLPLDELTSLRIEGGVLPPSFISKIQQKTAPYTDSRSYGLAGGYTLNDAITRAWNRLKASWKVFTREQERIKGNPSAGFTREKILLPLLEELGYGRLPYRGSIEVNHTRYPISHMYGTIPFHLVGADTDLDKRTEGIAGATRKSPHGLVMEYLNQVETASWGFLSNGKLLRLLRKSHNITRQSYLEFNLEYILEEEGYAGFALLYMFCHVSRFEKQDGQMIIEAWRMAGSEEGERAMEDLRTGVEDAIKVLGRGLLSHPKNQNLRQALKKGRSQGGMDNEEFYHLLLILVYRLVFLFVAEYRDALLDPEAPYLSKQRYLQYYSTRRLRKLAQQFRGGPHTDLWRGLCMVMGFLGEKGCKDLALHPLGSFLWEPDTLSTLTSCELSNYFLLEAIRKLAFTQRANALWPTDFVHLGSEELGSVYEALLELHPQIDLNAKTFDFAQAAGSARKTTGSYYTPSELVERILDDNLEPVLQKAMESPHPEESLLQVKVCDPAMGSGHFLTAAASRIARRLAQVRTGEEDPSPTPIREALQDVVKHCIYGVDLNPLAVELCKISLWMTALQPGRPLAFLDHHLKCGNSLLGTTRALMKKGIPQGAFEVLTGDDPSFVRSARRQNEEYQKDILDLISQEEVFPDYGRIAEEVAKLETLEETTLEGVRLLATRYRELVEAPEYLTELSAAHGWCAAFFQEKNSSASNTLITNRQFYTWLKDCTKVEKPLRALAEKLAAQYRFFHWELAFPEVFRPTYGEEGGFHVILGNPPWERIKLQEQEWFASRDPRIAHAPNAAARNAMIQDLKTQDPTLFREYLNALRESEGISSFLRKSGRYPLCGKGDINLYSVFVELGRSLLRPSGRLGMVVPSGIATDDTTKKFFEDIINKKELSCMYHFDNRTKLFPAVDSRISFCLFNICRSNQSGNMTSEIYSIKFRFFAHNTLDLSDPERIIELTPQDLQLINPNTHTCPIFRTRKDAEITRKVYRSIPVLLREGDPAGNPWGVSFLRLFDMANDSPLFHTRDRLEGMGYRLVGNIFYPPEYPTPPHPYLPYVRLDRKEHEAYGDPGPLFSSNPQTKSSGSRKNRRPDQSLKPSSKESSKGGGRFLPLYEARMVHQYTHRWATYRGKEADESALEDLQNPDFEPLPRYWVAEEEVEKRLSGRWDRGWLLGWRDITNVTNERTVIASVIPRVGAGNTFLVLFTEKKEYAFCLNANLNSMAFDFISRQKVGGTHLTYNLFKQLPFLPPEQYVSPCPWAPGKITLADWIRPRVLELVYTSHALLPFALDTVHPPGPNQLKQVRAYWEIHFPGRFPPEAPYPAPFPYDPERRFTLRCELDAAYFHLYGIDRQEVEYILETFPIVKNHDLKNHGRYRTKETILEYYDQYGRSY